MRILILNHFPLNGSGSGVYTSNLAHNLMRQGHEPYVITPGHQPSTETRFPVETIYFLNPGGNSEPGCLPFNFPTFTHHSFSDTTFGSLNQEQKTAYFQAWETAIREVVDYHKPQVIHSQHIWVASYFATQTGIPTVVTAHGTDLIGYDIYPTYRKMADSVINACYQIFASSQDGLEAVLRLYDVSPEKVTLIEHGYDETLFRVLDVNRSEVLANYGLPDSTYVVLFVGRLAQIKGVDLLLRAAARYEKELGDVQTLIVGAGEHRLSLEEMARSLSLQKTHFLGYQFHPQLAQLYNIADLGVFPSHAEMFGLAALEAMACGTPVIATEVGGYLDTVKPPNGVLVPVDDSDVLGQAIIDHITSKQRRTQSGSVAAFAPSEASWENRVNQMITIYEQMHQQITL